MKRLGTIFKILGAVLIIITTAVDIKAQSLSSTLNSTASLSALQLHSTPVQNTEPQRRILQSDATSLTIEYSFNGFAVSQKTHKGSVYNYLHIKDFQKMGEVGKPALPAHNDIILLPGDDFSIQILEAPYTEYQGYNIFPALEPASDEAGSAEPPFVIDSKTYSTNAFFPQQIVKLQFIQKVRGMNIGIFQVRPIQYNPVTHKIRVYEHIKYKVIFNGVKSGFLNAKYKNSTRFLRAFRGSVLNKNLLPKRAEISAKSQDAKDIILLTTPEFADAADTLAKWKRQMGYTVKIISDSAWTPAAVSDSVHTLYQSWTPHPDYLIILGDQEDVPADSIPYGATYYLTDLYYVTMDGTGDYLADMAHGRISVSNASEAMTTVLKIVNYERNPVSDPSFYSNALTCTYFQDGYSYTSTFDGYADRRFLHTTEEIRSYLLTKNYNVNRVYYAFDNRNPTHYNNGFYSDGQAIPSDLLVSNGFNWNGSTADIASNINAGKFLVFHRDHGYTDGYGWEHPYFLNQEASALVSNGNNINQLTNGNKLPVVLSINCHTGDFKRPECFAENFLRKSNGGAVGVIAPSYSSYSGYNDALADGLIDAIWSNPGLIPDFGTGGTTNPSLNSHSDIYSMGDVLNQGLLRMTQTWASSTKYQMQNETYNYFGDPSMKIWTAAPQTISATGIDTLLRFDSSMTINSNCNGCIATLMVNDTVIASAELLNGSATLSFSVPGDVRGILTITGHNYRPLIKHIHINNIIKQTPPSSQARNIRFIADDGSKSSSITVEWDKGDGDFDLVKISDDGNFTDPVNGVEYSADNYYSGSGEQVVFSGEGTSVTVFNLVSGNTYWFRVYEYNNQGVYTLYQTSTGTANPNSPDGGTTLPVEIASFSAKVIDGKVYINWTTNSERNNDKFLIQKSIDAANYKTAGEVKGMGNSNIPLDYSFVDEKPAGGISYYRLAQTDFDGNIKYYSPVQVQVANTKLIEKISQDAESITLNIDKGKTPAVLKLTDLSGRTLFSELINPSSQLLKIPKDNLSRGIYMLTMETSNGRQVIKLFVN